MSALAKLIAPSAYIDTDLGPLPFDWLIRRVDDVCILVNGRGFKPYEWRDRGLPIIRIQNLNGSDEFNYFDGAYNRKIEIAPGQLLFAWSGSRGTSFGPHIWLGPMGLLNYHTWKVAVDAKAVSPDFIFHALKGLTEYIEEQAHGAAALVHVQKWQMEGFQLALPPTIGEQQAIATALSDADGLTEALESLIAKKRAVKQGAMQELLSGRTRLPGFSGEWQEKVIGEVASIDPENLGAQTPRDYAFNYIALEDVNVGSLVGYSERVFQTAPSRARRKLHFDDILVATVRPNLKSHLLFRIEHGDWICSTGFSVIRCYPGKATPGFILAHLFGEIIARQIDALISGSNYPAINSRDVAALRVPIPPVDEQIAIAAALSDMDDELAALETRLAKARAIKQGMMQELLTGRVRLI